MADIIKAEIGLPSSLTDMATDNMRAAHSDNTLKAYATQCRLWEEFAETHNIDAWPADYQAVCSWLSWRAQQGQAISTLRTAVYALRAAHEKRGLIWVANHPAIRMTLKGIWRNHGREQKQAPALRGKDVEAILASCGDTEADRRDAALIACGYILALRRSELVSLDYAKRGIGNGHIEITPESVLLKLVQSKTGKVGEVETVVVPRSAVPKAVAAIEAWVSMAGIEPGTALLRGVDVGGNIKGRLSTRSVPRIIQRRLEMYYVSAGTPPEKARAMARQYSGHSLRVGFCVTAAEHGATAESIGTVTRHKSLEMPTRYAKQADKKRRSPFRLDGVGV